MATRVSEITRFFAKVDVQPNGCWHWLGCHDTNGYAQFRGGGRDRTAHSWIMEVVHGPRPPDLVHDHLCCNKGCVNPAHLERVTPRENLMRAPHSPAARNAAKTHCAQGHPFDEQNTCYSKGRRSCRACVRAYYHRKKAERAQG